MLRKHLLITLCTLAIASGIEIKLQDQVTSKIVSMKRAEVDWSFKINCRVLSDVTKLSVSWQKDGNEVVLSERVSISNEGNDFNLTIKEAKEDDMGAYSCIVETDVEYVKKTTILFGVGVPEKKKVTEGDKLELHCFYIGDTELAWKVNGSHVPVNDGKVQMFSDDAGKENAILYIGNLMMNDTGVYSCVGNSGEKFVETSTIVTVIDPNAALLPFFCICAEVVVLCIIIFIYEKKRYKKPEDEGEVEELNEQKSTKENSGVRQRN